MEDLALSGTSSDAAGSGCNYQASSAEDVEAAVSAADHQSSAMLMQQRHLDQLHQFQTADQARALPPQYDSLASLNNNNSYTAADSENDAKYHHLSAHLLGQGQGQGHSYHHHLNRYQLDNHHHHQQQQQQQQLAHYQPDYCNAVSYGMTSSSSLSAISGSGVVSRAGYCGRGQFDLVAAAAAAYSASDPRSQAGYWTTSCGVGADQQQQPADLDDQADVKPTLLDPSSYLMHTGQYPTRHQSYLPGWYGATGYSWGVPCANDVSGGYYAGSCGFNDTGTHQTTSPPMHHILRGVYNTLQVSHCPSMASTYIYSSQYGIKVWAYMLHASANRKFPNPYDIL